MIQAIKNGWAHCICQCGEQFVFANTIRECDPFARAFQKRAEIAICPKCKQVRRDAEEALRKNAAEKRAQGLRESAVLRCKLAGFRFADIIEPPVPQTATWLWSNRGGHVLLAGETGTGKTTSVTVVVKSMLMTGDFKCRYATRRELTAEYVRAKTDDADSEEHFWRRIGHLDLLVVDELVGKRGKERMSDTAQELLFELLDGAYSGHRKTRIWLMGNFYAGAVGNMVSDAEPFKRRLRESFKCGWATGKTVENIDF